jgi:histidinol-phosphate aminotransferase
MGATRGTNSLIHLNLNENAFGASSKVALAITRELPRLSHFADDKLASGLKEQIATYEQVDTEQIVLGETLSALGLYLGGKGGPRGEFIYSTPGYLALIAAAAHVGGIGISVPLNARLENDLPALSANIVGKTRALYLINPHNPTGTVTDDQTFRNFVQDASKKVPVIVDEAYLDYTPDFAAPSVASLTRAGANVTVLRTFDKIHGLAGLPTSYTIAPKALAVDLHAAGAGRAEGLGRLNLVAASAALSDKGHVEQIRDAVARERAKWKFVLDELKLPHSRTETNFIFFDAGRPQPELALQMREQGIDIGRMFPPFTNWARITIGLPEENQRAQKALRSVLLAPPR